MRLKSLLYAAVIGFFAATQSSAFVVLNTSIDPPSAKTDSASTRAPQSAMGAHALADRAMRDGNATAPSMTAATSATKVDPSAQAKLPHYGTVLFLSADNMIVYSYLGVLKALEEFGLEPDLVLAESKAVPIGAAWALEYPAARMEKKFSERPLEHFLRPFPEKEITGRKFLPAGPDPIQWEIPLGLQSLENTNQIWSSESISETGEYLHLSWFAAKLSHDGPAGPIEDVSQTPRRLAVQVADLSNDQATVLMEGSLQGLIKGGLLPTEVMRKRPRLWPYASGALLSGHGVMIDKLPFTYDRIILIEPGRHLRPPALENVALSWTDSLSHRVMRKPFDVSNPDQNRVMRIELEPAREFDPQDPVPADWIELGYTSALRSMDVLKSVLAKSSRKGKDSPAENRETSLGLNRVSVNTLASGGRELLLDLVRTSENNSEDTTGEASIASLVKSGFYSDLDLEWTSGPADEKAVLVFDAKEKSQLALRGGVNLSSTGELVTDRGPEVFAGLLWCEPFYIPFRLDVGALLGGHQPGYETRFMVTPIYPVHLELGVSRTHWEIHYPLPIAAAESLGAPEFEFRLHRTLSELFLKIYAAPSTYFRTSIQRHEMQFPPPDDVDLGDFLSTDFQETACMGFGKSQGEGIYPHFIWLQYRSLNRVNLFGRVTRSAFSVESRLKFTLGDFAFSDQYFWSNQDVEDYASRPALSYDEFQAGRINIFTFQDEFFLRYLRSLNFQDIKIDYCPTWKKAGLKLTVGGYRNYGPFLYPEQEQKPIQSHWEAQAGYATPIGSLRVGAGGLGGQSPFYFIRFGADLGLGFE